MSVTKGPWAKEPARKPIEEFNPFTPATWEGQPVHPINWMVEGCFIKGTVAMLSGDGGLGKSLLMQQLMTAAATGQEWLGIKTRPGKSFALFCEDDKAELQRRQANINRYYGCSMGDLGESVMFESRVGRDAVLMKFGRWGDESQVTPLFEQVRHACRSFGAEYIILDTRADIFSGNEVDRTQPRTFIRHLRRLAIECQAVVIMTEHPSAAGMSDGSGRSGSTGWNNSVRSRLYLTTPKKDADSAARRVLKTMKSNAGPRGGKVDLVWEGGVFVPEAPTEKSPGWWD